jgi:hypothetical protein
MPPSGQRAGLMQLPCKSKQGQAGETGRVSVGDLWELNRLPRCCTAQKACSGLSQLPMRSNAAMPRCAVRQKSCETEVL